MGRGNEKGRREEVIEGKRGFEHLSMIVCWLVVNVPATCQFISGTDLLRRLQVVPHRSNFPPHPITIY